MRSIGVNTEYDFNVDHDLRHHTEIVYEKIRTKIQNDDEFIIKKAIERIVYKTDYEVANISNYGTMYYCIYDIPKRAI